MQIRMNCNISIHTTPARLTVNRVRRRKNEDLRVIAHPRKFRFRFGGDPFIAPGAGSRAADGFAP